MATAVSETLVSSFNNTGNTKITLTHRSNSWAFLSADDDVFVEPNDDAHDDSADPNGSWLVLKNTTWAPQIPCTSLYIRGANGSGVARVTVIFQET